MGTGVHGIDGIALSINSGSLAGIGFAGFLKDGEGIHIRPQQYRGAFTVFQYTYNTVTADFFGDCETQSAQLIRHSCTGFLFLERYLGILVQVNIKGFQVRVIVVNCRPQCSIRLHE